MQADTAYNIFSLLTGALIGPAVGLWLGRHLGRPTPNLPTVMA
jgi:membrane protein DedA with SNARE-associated domain